MTKLTKVLEFCNKNNVFTWKKFIKSHKCDYPCTETNYLSMLVNAGYIEKPGRGKYQVNITPAIGMSYNQLAHEAYSKPKKKNVKDQFIGSRLRMEKTTYLAGCTIDQYDYSDPVITLNLGDAGKLIFDASHNIFTHDKLRDIYQQKKKIKITVEEV